MPKRNLVLFDDVGWSGLRPLTWLRPVAELRIGALTMRARWERLLTADSSTVTQDYLAEAYPLHVADDNYFVNASLLPTWDLARRILQLEHGEAIVRGQELLAARLDAKLVVRLGEDGGEGLIPGTEYEGEAVLLRRPYDLFRHNARMIAFDFDLLCGSRHSVQLSSSNTIFGGGKLFAEAGVHCEAVTINTADGPVYIGSGATIMEGSLLRGPLAICADAVVKMGTKLYGGTTVGPHCKVGGEITNVVFQAYSNKGHDGYLGNAVIGRWCNIGAGTSASNLKNNYAEVRVYDYDEGRFADSGGQFVGLTMGDHAKCGINTMFNTGTVVGIAANVFGAGFPRAFVPDFSWGGAAGFTTHRLDKVRETAGLVMERRGFTLGPTEAHILEAVFAATSPLRTWERAAQNA